jgi:hypothetical protein
MSKGGGKSQTVTTNNAPWAQAQPHWQNIFGQAQALSQQPAYSQGTQGLQNSIISASQQPNALAQQAQGELSKTLGGGYADPYARGVLDDVMGMARSKINSQFGGDNFGNSAHQEWLGRGITSAALPFASQMYGDERNRQMQAAQMAPGVGNMDLSRLGFGLNTSMMADQGAWNQLKNYGSLLQGAGGGTSTQTQPLNSDPLGQLLGYGLAGAGIYSMLSDVRLKTDIEKVGEKDGFNVYQYRYKGRPETHVGVMAQEVLMKKPEAVQDINGLLAVDYSKLGDK